MGIAGEEKISKRVELQGRREYNPRKRVTQQKVVCGRCKGVVGHQFFDWEEKERDKPEMSYKFYHDDDRNRHVFVRVHTELKKKAMEARKAKYGSEELPNGERRYAMSRRYLEEWGLDASLAEKLENTVFVGTVDLDWMVSLRKAFFQHVGLKYAEENCKIQQFVVLIALLESVYGTATAWERFFKNVGKIGGHWKYQSETARLEKHIQNKLDAFIPTIRQINTLDKLTRRLMEVFKVQNRIEELTGEHPYTRTNEGRVFIAIDLRSANFNVIRFLTGIRHDSWERYIKSIRSDIAVSPYTIEIFSQSKQLRQRVLGKICPWRVTRAQKIILELLWHKMKGFLEGCLDLIERPYLSSTDELLIPVRYSSAVFCCGILQRLDSIVDNQKRYIYISYRIKKAVEESMKDCPHISTENLFRVEAYKLYVREYSKEMALKASTIGVPTQETKPSAIELNCFADSDWEDKWYVPFHQPVDHYFIRLNLETDIPQLKHIPAPLYIDALKHCRIINKQAPFEPVKAICLLEERVQY